MLVKFLRYCTALSLIFLTMQLNVARGQVFPGDADNNGQVNHLDVLNVGYAWGTTGPARLETGGQPATQAIPVTWEEFFPQGLNYAFADADGNGVVNFLDLATISSNYGQVHDGGTEFVNFYEGVPDIHSQLILDKNEVPDYPTSGTYIEIPVLLGSEELPLESFQGIAFTIEYDSDYIADIEFTFDESSWINSGEGSFDFIGPEDEIGSKEIAISRKGNYPVDGSGKIGTVSLIVIDDLGTLLASPTDSSNVIINIKEIKAVNGDFWTVPIASDSVSVMVYGPDALPLSTNDPDLAGIRVYPNPAQDFIRIESPTVIKEVALVNSFGQLLRAFTIREERNFKVDLPEDFPGGLYCIQIYTDSGVLTKKIIINR
ncbi:MAG: T9SS C-terminal target domain-containing protein [Bacteroidetes bacterium]|nr:MAG: T9SS C-terminal target domain-containing protein [Bacteroidota bacterium]